MATREIEELENQYLSFNWPLLLINLLEGKVSHFTTTYMIGTRLHYENALLLLYKAGVSHRILLIYLLKPS